jgi:beta-1,2-mannobiose phosphorylase / 1,2-beta-oligomannan phosphorylase
MNTRPTATKSKPEMTLTRHEENPVLAPCADHQWEKDAVLNSAVVHEDGTFHLFYRGVAHYPGDHNRSCIGHAWSSDGVHFERRDTPVLRSGEVPGEDKGCEDPRVTRINGAYHMLYTAWDEKESKIAMAVSADMRDWERRGVVLPFKEFGHNKNAALFSEKIRGKYLLLHRPMGHGEFVDRPPDTPLGIMVSYSDDMSRWTDHRALMQPRPGRWDERKIGIAGPPIRTEKGWLLIYHGVDSKWTYRLGVALLDLEDPTKILKRQDEPILEPETQWEQVGDVPNVVFSCGGALIGDELWVYYGGADTVIGLARGSVREFLGR